jgi:hypothetical protein
MCSKEFKKMQSHPEEEVQTVMCVFASDYPYAE